MAIKSDYSERGEGFSDFFRGLSLLLCFSDRLRVIFYLVSKFCYI